MYTHPDFNLSGGRKREFLGKLLAFNENTGIACLWTHESIRCSLYISGANVLSQSDSGTCRPYCYHTSEGPEPLSSAVKAGKLCQDNIADEHPFVVSSSVSISSP